MTKRIISACVLVVVFVPFLINIKKNNSENKNIM